MNNIQPKVGMWVQIPKLTKKEQKYSCDVTSGKNYQIIRIDKDGDIVVMDDVNEEHCFSLKNNNELSSKPLILLDENQQPLTIEKQTVKEESKPQITAQEMYIKELEKTAKSLREQLETLDELRNKEIEHLENKLDEAYKEQEEMMISFKEGLKHHKYNLIQTLICTSTIKVQDIRVFTDILIRTLEREYKFESKDSEEN